MRLSLASTALRSEGNGPFPMTPRPVVDIAPPGNPWHEQQVKPWKEVAEGRVSTFWPSSPSAAPLSDGRIIYVFFLAEFGGGIRQGYAADEATFADVDGSVETVAPATSNGVNIACTGQVSVTRVGEYLYLISETLGGAFGNYQINPNTNQPYNPVSTAVFETKVYRSVDGANWTPLSTIMRHEVSNAGQNGVGVETETSRNGIGQISVTPTGRWVVPASHYLTIYYNMYNIFHDGKPMPYANIRKESAVWRSDDQGQSWTRAFLAEPIPPNPSMTSQTSYQAVFTNATSASNSPNIAVYDGSLYWQHQVGWKTQTQPFAHSQMRIKTSADNGNTWTTAWADTYSWSSGTVPPERLHLLTMGIGESEFFYPVGGGSVWEATNGEPPTWTRIVATLDGGTPGVMTVLGDYVVVARFGFLSWAKNVGGTGAPPPRPASNRIKGNLRKQRIGDK